MSRGTLTQDRLREILSYDPETGIFTNVANRANVRCGDLSGGMAGHSYVRISCDRRRYYAHRLAFLAMTGEFPFGEVDHINGCHTDNRWSNLRLASRAENSRNLGLNKTNSTGFKGVRVHKDNRHRNKKYQARIRIEGREKSLGYYSDIRDAHRAYLDAAKKYFGDFARAA